MVSGGIVSKALYRTDIAGERLEDISEAFVGGSVRYREQNGAGQMTFTMDLIGPQVVDDLGDFVSPFVTYAFDDGTEATYRLGVYVVAQPDAELTQTTARLTYPCEDLMSVVRDSAVDTVYKIPTGTNIGTAIADVIEDAGIVKYRLPRTTRTTGYNRANPRHTGNLDIANNLTAAARWFPMAMALDGALTTAVSRRLTQTQPIASFTNDDYIGSVLHKPTRGQVANVVKVRRERSDQPTLYAVRKNEDVDSPISIPNVNREIVYGGGWIDARDAEDQEDVDEVADRLIEEARSYERTIEVTLPPNPAVLGAHRVVDFDLETDEWDVYGRFWVNSWEIGFTPQDATMRLVCNRLVRFNRGEDVS